MQIIFVSNRMKAAKTVTIMPQHVLISIGGLLAVILATSAIFSWLSIEWRLPLVEDLVSALQRRENQKTQEVVANNLQMMATRVGELQAQVLQLDSLSERLAALAGIKRETAGDKKPQPGSGGPLIAAPYSYAELQQEIDRLGRLVGNRSDELTMLEGRLLEKKVRDRLLPTTLPLKGATGIGSAFGHREDPIAGVRAMHEGIDFLGPMGAPISAAAAGVVVTAEYHPEFGNMVDIDHGEGLISRYAHMSKLLVRSGQLVRRGAPIGLLGNTGRSTGPHLHFEVRMLGRAQNPAVFLRQSGDPLLAKLR